MDIVLEANCDQEVRVPRRRAYSRYLGYANLWRDDRFWRATGRCDERLVPVNSSLSRSNIIAKPPSIPSDFDAQYHVPAQYRLICDSNKQSGANWPAMRCCVAKTGIENVIGIAEAYVLD